MLLTILTAVYFAALFTVLAVKARQDLNRGDK